MKVQIIVDNSRRYVEPVKAAAELEKADERSRVGDGYDNEPK